MRRDDVRRTLICYDVPHDRRRARLASTLEKYGDRVQYSVFVVDISPARLLRLKDETREIINSAEDSVLFCDLGRLAEVSSKNFSYVGQTRPITDNDSLII